MRILLTVLLVGGAWLSLESGAITMAEELYPGLTWGLRTPEEVGLVRDKLDALRDLVGGHGCVVRHGYMVYTWGEEGKIKSVDDKVAEFEPRLKTLNNGKDADITWRHLASQTSGYGLADVLQFQGSYTFEAFGPNDRPGRLAISVRDFARFGLLYLRGGKWKGKQVLGPELIKLAVSSPVPPDTPLTSGKEAEMLPNQIISWNDAEVEDLKANPGNPNTRYNQAVRSMKEAIMDRPGNGNLSGTQLGIKGSQFTLNGRPTFLLGISYYGALGAPEEFIKRDLDDMQRYGFNWIRVWATWDAFGNDVSAVDGKTGAAREPFLSKLKSLVAGCDRRGMVVDVTISRGKGLQTLEAHRRAVETLVAALKEHRNWYLDLANERNIRDPRFVSFEELKELRDLAKRLDPERLITASHAGDIGRDDLREYLLNVRVDFISPHRPRDPDSPKQTEARSREYLAWMKEIGRVVPLHYQEPFRRDFGRWQPKAEDYVTDVRGAKAGGAAGWCFHNGDQKGKPEGKPRRSFDLSEKRLFDQLDEEERKAIEELRLLFSAPSGNFMPRTHVAIVNGKWHINGTVTYPGTKAEGLLMNVRMVNAVFEDRNRPDFDPDANTNRFIARIPDYVAHGVRAFTINLQGGFPGYEGAVNSAFNPDGSLRESYLKRVWRVIEACDRQGAVVILGCYYQRQDQILKDADAVRAGVVNVVRWIVGNGFTNVVLEIANEFPHQGFDHPILRTPEGQVELIRLAKRMAPDLLVSTSGIGDGKLSDSVAEASDFLLIHFNGVPVHAIPERIAALKRFGKPIVCNEDDKVGEEAAKAAEASVAHGASWGLMLKEVNQYFPFAFNGAADDPVVYAKLRELTSISNGQDSAAVAIGQRVAGKKPSTSSPVVPTDRAATVAVGRGGELRVDGKPFLPLFVWLQPIRNFDFLASLGINTFMGEGGGGETARQFLDALKERGLWGVIHANPENFPLKNHPALLTWMFGDEPDLPAQTSYERPVAVLQDARGHVNVWWEGEGAERTNFLMQGWMDEEVSKHLLSGGGWLSTDAERLPPEGAFHALYRIEVPQTARYTLWVREFIKSWASPTWWRFDSGTWQHIPRDLKSLEPQKVHRVLTVGWHRYGTVELTAGRHTFEIKVDEKRTAGTPDKVGDEFMVAFDAFLLTTGDQAPLAPARPPRPRFAPEEIERQYAALKQVDTSHPVYLNLTARFLPEQRTFAPFYTDELYRGYARATDIVGYDLYPITGWGKPEWVPKIASATRKLRELAPPHVPVWVILECTTKLQWVSQERLNQIGRPQGATATELRAMVWMALINGAKGIGYFPHRWDPYKQCDISAELQAEMKRTNRQLTELAPVILGLDVEGVATVEDMEGGPVEFAVKKADGSTVPYLFLVNVSALPARVRLRLSGAKALIDLDSGETTAVDAEGVALAFEPLQVRLFALK